MGAVAEVSNFFVCRLGAGQPLYWVQPVPVSARQIALFQMTYETPSRRAIASGFPNRSGACSHPTKAPAIDCCPGTRTFIIQSSARPSS